MRTGRGSQGVPGQTLFFERRLDACSVVDPPQHWLAAGRVLNLRRKLRRTLPVFHPLGKVQGPRRPALQKPTGLLGSARCLESLRLTWIAAFEQGVLLSELVLLDALVVQRRLRIESPRIQLDQAELLMKLELGPTWRGHRYAVASVWRESEFHEGVRHRAFVHSKNCAASIHARKPTRGPRSLGRAVEAPHAATYLRRRMHSRLIAACQIRAVSQFRTIHVGMSSRDTAGSLHRLTARREGSRPRCLVDGVPEQLMQGLLPEHLVRVLWERRA